jgi:D-glycero-alpha-D-manno-heptose-7-phosphate kinase
MSSSMIVSKTPLRIPLAGGLTDIRAYAEAFGGVTVSAAVDRYLYVVLKANPGGVFELRYQDTQEKAADGRRIRHDLVRESLRLTGLLDTPMSLHILADLASESGLGASGALTVSLLHAMHRFKGEAVSAAELAREAGHIEVEVLEGASGYHDPTITALGGLKLIEYRGAEAVARDVALSGATRQAFIESLLFFYSGRHARTKPSLDLLGSRLEEAYPVLHELKAIAYELESAFAAGDVRRIAEIIGEQQTLKQRLPGKFVDDYVLDVTRRVREVGAYAQLPGGKISAFVIVACPDGQQDAVRAALADLQEVWLGLEPTGTRATDL